MKRTPKIAFAASALDEVRDLYFETTTAGDDATFEGSRRTDLAPPKATPLAVVDCAFRPAARRRS